MKMTNEVSTLLIKRLLSVFTNIFIFAIIYSYSVIFIQFVDVNIFNWLEADKIKNSNLNPYEIEKSFLTHIWQLMNPYWEIIIPALIYLVIYLFGRKSVGEILFGLSSKPIRPNTKTYFLVVRYLLLVIFMSFSYSTINNLFLFAIWKAYVVIFIFFLFDFAIFFTKRRCLHDYVTGLLVTYKK